MAPPGLLTGCPAATHAYRPSSRRVNHQLFLSLVSSFLNLRQRQALASLLARSLIRLLIRPLSRWRVPSDAAAAPPPADVLQVYSSVCVPSSRGCVAVGCGRCGFFSSQTARPGEICCSCFGIAWIVSEMTTARRGSCTMHAHCFMHIYTGDELTITIIWLVARPFLRKTGWVVITLELCARLDEYA